MDQRYSEYEVLRSKRNKDPIFLIRKEYWDQFSLENNTYVLGKSSL